jgi:hypothetical protein
LKKARDYGTAWQVLRTISVVDQIFIKSPTHSYDSRKRPSENWRRYTEFKGIINYAVIGLIQLEQPADAKKCR